MFFPLSAFSKAKHLFKESCNIVIAALRADGRERKANDCDYLARICLLSEYILSICGKGRIHI